MMIKYFLILLLLSTGCDKVPKRTYKTPLVVVTDEETPHVQLELIGRTGDGSDILLCVHRTTLAQTIELREKLQDAIEYLMVFKRQTPAE